MSHTPVADWEKQLFAGYFKKGTLLALLWGSLLLFLIAFDSRFFLLTRPDFLIFVIIPPVMTFGKWVQIPHDDVSARLAILRMTLRIWLLMLVFFKLLSDVFIAPYDALTPPYWCFVLGLLAQQMVIFAAMCLLPFLQRKPYLFFLLFYFPLGIAFGALEKTFC